MQKSEGRENFEFSSPLFLFAKQTNLNCSETMVNEVVGEQLQEIVDSWSVGFGKPAEKFDFNCEAFCVSQENK